MRKALVVLVALCVVTAVAVAFAQGQGRQGQGRGRQPGRGGMQAPESMTSVVADGKIYILKGKTLYKVNASDMKVVKKNNIELPEDTGQMGRFSRMLGRMTLTVEGKNLFLLSYNAIHKINTETLEIAGTLSMSDLTPPEEEKEEGEEEGEKEQQEDF